MRVHASCIAIAGRGVLIAGPSGAGKSDLSLRLIDRGATLVSDDYTELTVRDGALVGAAPATIVGRIEVRGLGIVTLPALSAAPVVLRIEAGVPERMPAPGEWAMAGIVIPCFRLSLLEPSAPHKVELLLAGLA